MDAFNLADSANCGAPPYACYQEGTQALIPNYWSFAQQYVLDDNAWSSMRGPSLPNHLYAMAAASGPDIPHSVIDNPGSTWGCDATSTTRVSLFNGTKVFPCFSFTTLADEMQNRAVAAECHQQRDRIVELQRDMLETDDIPVLKWSI